MLLRPYYNGLRVSEAETEDLETCRSRYGPVGERLTLFLLDRCLGNFVVAGVAQWHEDSGGYRDPSYFGHFPGA